MPRPLRVFQPDVSLHVIHRGNNRTLMFRDDADYDLFLVFLKRAANRFSVRVHAFALMPNHYHLIVGPDQEDAQANTMQHANSRYVRYFNRKHARIGTLLSGRYKSLAIEDEAYWLTCLRYVELNPVRAGLVAAPADYRWTTYRIHALGEATTWIADHPVYQALGPTPAWRQAAYSTLCQISLSKSEETLQKFHADSAL